MIVYEGLQPLVFLNLLLYFHAYMLILIDQKSIKQKSHLEVERRLVSILALATSTIVSLWELDERS